LDRLLIGITKVPKEVYTATSSVIGLVAAYKLVVVPLMAWKNAQNALTTAIALNTTVSTAASRQMVVLSAAAANAARMTALATGGITLLVGAISVYLLKMGEKEQVDRKDREEMERKLSIQQQNISRDERQADFLDTLIKAHDGLTKALKNQNLTNEQREGILHNLDKTEKAMIETIGKEGFERLKTAGFTKDAVQMEMKALEDKRQKDVEVATQTIEADRQVTTSKLTEAKKRIGILEEEMKVQKAKADLEANSTGYKVTKKAGDIPVVGGFLNLYNKYVPKFDPFGVNNPTKENDKLANMESEYQKQLNAADEAQKRLDEISKESSELFDKALDPFKGASGKRTGPEQKSYDERKEMFSAEMSKLKHLVNIEADGYTNASEQMIKLKQIRDKFQDLDATDLYTIDEDIHRTGNDIKLKAKGISDPKEREAFKMPMNDIDNQIKQANMLKESASSLIDFYMAKQGALSEAVDDTTQRIGLYENRQKSLKDSNITLRSSLTTLADKQKYLDSLYATGSITLDEYNQQSEAVTSRLSSVTKEVEANSIAWWNDAKAIKDAKEQQLKDTFDFSDKWISHEKATREMNESEEYESWLRVQSRYLKGTELRKQADEQVYAAKKALISKEEKSLDEMISKEKSYLEKSKNAELDAIETKKKAFMDAQDEKIRAIDDQIKAEDNANSDLDYANSLAEKQARLAALGSAVGPDGIKERNDLLKEISKMQTDHNRDLQKRNLEAQKQALQDEKTAKEKAAEADKQAVENHYNDLLSAFDDFKNDVEGRAEALKNFQILKDSEKNADILKNFDTFISQYQMKMASITNLSQSQEEIDLQKYNSNIDKWNSGGVNEKTQAHEENEMFRKKYNIPADTGKLQHFKDGGVVRGRFGEATQVVAHAGEMYINPSQQSNLFKLLNFKIPQISIPSMDVSGPKTVNNHYYSFDNSIGSVAVNGTNGVAGLYDQRGGLISRQQSQGGKVR
jgi:hypothetical protein